MLSDADSKLLAIAKALENGEEPERTTSRDFIWWFGAQRRTDRWVDVIRAALRKHKLVTVPDFQQAYIDEEILFVRPPSIEARSATDSSESSLADDNPTHRIKKLKAANTEPTSVNPNTPLSEAITLMMAHGYSQLPVMTTPLEVKGIVSWESIGKRLALGQSCESVSECMDKHTEISSDESLLSAIQTIEDNDYVLVRDSRNRISGIVTSSDLSRQFHLLGEPFLLIGEIENYVRLMIEGKFGKEELAAARDPKDEDRQIEHVSDLAFGEYKRLVENPERWEKIGLHIDRTRFTNELERIRRIRNDVMHFDPDGIPEEDVEALRMFAGLLRQLAELEAI